MAFNLFKKEDEKKEKKAKPMPKEEFAASEKETEEKATFLPTGTSEDAYKILKNFYVSEKASLLNGFNQYVFKVFRSANKSQIKKQVEKIIENPETGKPMRYNRKGTREVYISPYRLAYAYLSSENKIIFLGIYHKDEQ